MSDERQPAAAIPRGEWEWYGSPGHHICGQWCRFHLCTRVGPWLVSTIGEYVHPRHSAGSERAEAAYLQHHPLGEEIGAGRLFETLVFRCGDEQCECGCGMPLPADWLEIDARGTNTRADARLAHYALCEKWAAVPEDER